MNRKMNGSFFRLVIALPAIFILVCAFGCGKNPIRQKHDAPILSCPEGASLFGAPPPKGDTLYCQKPAGTKHGPYIDWHFPFQTPPQKKSEGQFQNGKIHGRWTFWNKQGQKIRQCILKSNAINGEMIQWYPDGAIKAKTTFQSGIKQGQSSLWYSNGNKRREGNYADDAQEGWWTYWHEDGQFDEEIFYENGKISKRKPAHKQK